jgi:hypothetical protein
MDFSGWNTKASGTEDYHQPGSEYTFPGENTILWAQWSPTPRSGSPVITDVTLLTNTIDTASSAQDIQVSLSGTSVTGLNLGKIFILGPYGVMFTQEVYLGAPSFSGTADEGTFTFTISIPQNSPAGEYYVARVSLTDTNDRKTAYTVDDGSLQAQGWDLTINNTASSFNPPPVITSIVPLSSTFDSSTGPTNLDFRVSFTDNTGMSNFFMLLESESGDYQSYVSAMTPFTDFLGTSTDGSFIATAYLGPDVESGDWIVKGLNATDTEGGFLSIWSDDGSLQEAGLGNITVTNTGINVDNGAPQIKGISLDSTTIDTASAEDNVVMSIDVEDDFRLSSIDVNIVSPNTKQKIIKHAGTIDPEYSGTDTSGTFTFDLVFPQYSQPGDWYIESINLGDYTGANYVVGISDNSIEIAGLQRTITNTASVGDSQTPQINSVVLNSSVIDTSMGNTTIDMQITVSDDLELDSLYVEWYSESMSFLASDYYYISDSEYTGTSTSGTFAISIPFQSWYQLGNYNLTRITLTDEIGQIIELEPNSGLAQNGWDFTLVHTK